MPNTAESHEYRGIDQVTPQLTSGIAKLVLGSFDRNIFRHQNRQSNEHKYFFLIVVVPLFSSLLYTAKIKKITVKLRL